jgi:hypothetical protein
MSLIDSKYIGLISIQLQKYSKKKEGLSVALIVATVRRTKPKRGHISIE